MFQTQDMVFERQENLPDKDVRNKRESCIMRRVESSVSDAGDKSACVASIA